MIPTLVAFPEPEWVWVRLVEPGETVNDDLSYWREQFGLTSDVHAPIPRIPREVGSVWLDEDLRMVATLGDHEFAPAVTDRALAKRARRGGAVQLWLVTGADISADGRMNLTELFTAALDERAASALPGRNVGVVLASADVAQCAGRSRPRLAG